MYSKPKAKLYVKQRDRQQSRKVSPRNSDDSAYNTDHGGQTDSERMGEFTIQADIEDEWPKNFEQHNVDSDKTVNKVEEKKSDTNSPTGTKPSPIEDDYGFHDKAQKYMIKTDSYKDLTREKFITVPEPNTPREPKIPLQPRPRPSTSSVHSYGLTGGLKPVDAKNMHMYGTTRSIPNHIVAAKQPHYATLRAHHTKPKRQRMATVKAIPRDNVVRTVKGYHVGNNVTVRGHNTGHAIRQLKQRMSAFDVPDGGFKRTTVINERKEYHIQHYGIEIDKPEADVHIPGDYLSGRIMLETTASIEIRFVELLIVGIATVHFSKNDPNLAKDSQEFVLNKRSYVMGTPDGRWNSVITAGKYISKFKFRLPDHLPATIKYESKEHGFTFEVSYIIKTRICDEMGSASVRSTHSTNNYVKVLLSRRFPFVVKRPFDIHSVPNSLQPVSQAEHVNLGCLPIFFDAASLTLSLDRAVFLAGDEIRVKLTTNSKTAKRIRSLTCELQQHVFSSIKTRQMYSIVQIHEHAPEGFEYTNNGKSLSLFEFILPTHSQFIPSFYSGCKLVKASYTIMMTVVFTSCSGQVFLECPVGIGPSMTVNKQGQVASAVPVFVRPKRFPHFSRDSDRAKQGNGVLHTSTHKNHHVTLVSNVKEEPSFLCWN